MWLVSPLVLLPELQNPNPGKKKIIKKGKNLALLGTSNSCQASMFNIPFYNVIFLFINLK